MARIRTHMHHENIVVVVLVILHMNRKCRFRFIEIYLSDSFVLSHKHMLRKRKINSSRSSTSILNIWYKCIDNICIEIIRMMVINEQMVYFDCGCIGISVPIKRYQKTHYVYGTNELEGYLSSLFVNIWQWNAINKGL